MKDSKDMNTDDLFADSVDFEGLDSLDDITDELYFGDDPPEDDTVCELCGHRHDDDSHTYCEECGAPLTNVNGVI